MDLIFCDHLSKSWNCKVYFKAEYLGPTGSYKDRLAEVAVNDAILNKAKKLVVASSGNQGLAMAAAAARKGLTCLVLSTTSIRPEYKNLIAATGAELMLCADMSERAARLQEFSLDGYYPLSLTVAERSFLRQPGLKGYHEIAKEIVAALGDAPQYLCLPTCYGDGVLGTREGFEQATANGSATRIPNYIMVRARESDGFEAYSIETDEVTPQVREAISQYSAHSIFLDNDEFLDAKVQASELGLKLEIAAAGTISGFQKFVEQSPLPPTSSVVLLLTAKQREIGA